MDATTASGQKQTSRHHSDTMSALPPKADIERRDGHVRFVPKADIRIAASLFDHLSARVSTAVGIPRPSALEGLRLTTSSYLVGACTGRSAGFSPLKIRST